MSTSMKPTDNGELIIAVQKPQPEAEPDQSYIHTEQWQEGIAEALEDLKEGRYEEFDNVEDLLAYLKS